MLKPARRPLPTLFLSNDEYEILDGMATDRGMTVAELLKEVISPLVEEEDGRVVVLRLSERTWTTFVEFFEDESAECAMARCLDADADDFARALNQAGRV